MLNSGDYLTLFGIMFFSLGVLLSFVENWICLRIMRNTRHDPRALTITDIWLNTRMFVKRYKLHMAAEHGETELLKTDALKALRLERASTVFVVLGLLLVILGRVIA
jgi:hypothetical protein